MRFALVLITGVAGFSPASEFIRTAPAGDPHFYDEHGRVRIFHGSNRVQKSSPWFFPDMVDTDAEFQLMRKMGFNVMRLGYMWTGVMPEENVFNQTYIDTVKGIVNKMASHGVYTLLDMHQDVLSSKFCLYDGAPLWVINKSTPKHAFPWPFKGNCSSRGWMTNTLTEAAGKAFQDIYDNKAGMLDDLAAFWEKSAQEFKDMPSVIGYETMNEPFAGDIYGDPLLLLPGVAGRKNLQRLHDRVADAIHKHDDKHIIFYEPVTWGMLFNGNIAGSGFSHVPGGAAYQNRSAFSFHYYCASFVPGYDGKLVPRELICDHVTGPLVMEAVKKDLAHLGGGAMMTEGLACPEKAEDECEFVMNKLDSNLYSFTDYGESQGSTWQPSFAQQQAWARTYAQAVAGTPTKMTFDRKTKNFDFCFTLDVSIAAPTEIFASDTYTYPKGKTVVASDNLVVDTSTIDTVLLTASKDAKSGSQACVTIKVASASEVLV